VAAPGGQRLRRVRLALAAALCAVPLAAPAQLFTDTESRKAIAAQQQRITELARQNDALRERVVQLDERIGQLETTVKSINLLEIVNQLELLRGEIARLRGQQEVLAHGIDTGQRRQRDQYVDLDTRLRRLEQAAVPAAATVPPVATAPAAAAGSVPGAAPLAGATGPAPAAAAPDAAEQRAYDAAHQLRRIGNFHGAIAGFQGFIQSFPKSRLVAAAQFWIGDSQFNLRDFKSAIASQRQLLAAFPASDLAPDALLNIASSQTELGDTAAARKTLEEVIARFPNSEAAEHAKRRLPRAK
jgi:tol-pal system protein YbgF